MESNNPNENQAAVELSIAIFIRTTMGTIVIKLYQCASTLCAVPPFGYNDD
jgi:hypothetical protein